MNPPTVIVRVATIALVASVLSACAATVVSMDTPPAGIDEFGARQTLLSLRTRTDKLWLSLNGFDNRTRDEIGGTPITGGADSCKSPQVAVGRDVAITPGGLQFKQASIPFDKISAVQLPYDDFKRIVQIVLSDHRCYYIGSLYMASSNNSQAIANAIVVLKQADASRPARDAAFAKVAAEYRAANPKPEPGEQQRRREVQAETLVANKRFQDAARVYSQALGEAPWWPQGHFNFALVLETVGDYALAIEQMQQYLALVPDAPNARAARDKIYSWQAQLPR